MSLTDLEIFAKTTDKPTVTATAAAGAAGTATDSTGVETQPSYILRELILLLDPSPCHSHSPH
jgi:hypothetical protein